MIYLISTVYQLFVDSPDPISALVFGEYGPDLFYYILIIDIVVQLLYFKVIRGSWQL